MSWWLKKYLLLCESLDKQKVIHTHNHPKTQAKRQQDKSTERQIDRKTNRQKYNKTERQIDRKTNRQKDNKTKRQIDRQTNIQKVNKQEDPWKEK